jgi:hypothetical protein
VRRPENEVADVSSAMCMFPILHRRRTEVIDL